MLFAEGDDAVSSAIRGFGCGSRSGGSGPEEVGSGLFSESSQEVAEGTRSIVASLGGFIYGASFMEVGSDGFVPPHGQAVGLGKEVGQAHDRKV